MHIVRPLSSYFRPENIVDPKHCGAVAWSDFNRSFHKLQQDPWWRINESTKASLGLRILRLLISYYVHRVDGFLNLRGKAQVLALFRKHLPSNPDIVYFGAEAGWEAIILQSILGHRGRVLLIDNDPVAHQRYTLANDKVEILIPTKLSTKRFVLRRDRKRIEYLQQDLFEVECSTSFDIGIDWGLVEHFLDSSKITLIRKMRQFLRCGGWQISSVPKDSYVNRLFYRAFCDELNFGHRELMTLSELHEVLVKGGFEVIESLELLDSFVVLSRKSPESAGERLF